jgi:hypothetical protein
MIRKPRLPVIGIAFLAGLTLMAGPALAQSQDTYPAPPQGAYPAPPQGGYPAPPQGGYPTPPQTTYPAAPQTTYPAPPQTAYPSEETYTVRELVDTGHGFFGQVSEGLATVVEHAVASYGLPNGYILGQEGSGALIGGLRYGEGSLYTKNAGQHQIFWQGPSIGFDIGAEGNRTMMLVYNLPNIEGIYDRFAGVAGSAYLVAGVGMTVLAGKGMYVVPIVSGVGARLGINIGYLKFTPKATWNPF